VTRTGFCPVDLRGGLTIVGSARRESACRSRPSWRGSSLGGDSVGCATVVRVSDKRRQGTCPNTGAPRCWDLTASLRYAVDGVVSAGVWLGSADLVGCRPVRAVVSCSGSRGRECGSTRVRCFAGGVGNGVPSIARAGRASAMVGA